jgi:hypothetical protein
MNRWEDNNNMDLKKIGVDWINLACGISQPPEELPSFQANVCSMQTVSLT